MEKTVVLYPGLAVSHFVPMMQLAARLLEHGYAVSVALIDPGVMEDIVFSAVVARVAASMPSVSFHTLPGVEDPPKLTLDIHFIPRYLDLLRRYNERLHDFLSSMHPHAVVVDSLSSEAVVVAKRLGIPCYNLFTCSASILAAFSQLPTLLPEGGASFGELADNPIDLFGLPPMPASHLLAEMLEDPESETYKATMGSVCWIMEANGTLVNTFESLEARGVAALRDPRCVPGRVLPPVYCVGPFVGAIAEAKERHECLVWLDGQPDRSVVFLCFGSIGAESHSKEQLREIAVGLNKSGHSFLRLTPSADPDLHALLPDGFMERTSGCGLVVKLWAPQLDVLCHRAIGGRS
ncbi:hypothetical protein VPH35_042197 [Triticum aestivum]